MIGGASANGSGELGRGSDAVPDDDAELQVRELPSGPTARTDSTASGGQRGIATTHTHPWVPKEPSCRPPLCRPRRAGDTGHPLDRVAFTGGIREAMVPMAYALQLNRLAGPLLFETSHEIAAWFGNDASALCSTQARHAGGIEQRGQPLLLFNCGGCLMRRTRSIARAVPAKRPCFPQGQSPSRAACRCCSWCYG